MKCQRCNQREAALRVQRTARGKTEQVNICHVCAQEVGVQPQSSSFFDSPFSGFPGFSGNLFDDPFFASSSIPRQQSIPQRPAEQVNILDAFSERAKTVVQTAAEEAQKAGSPTLDTEHLLIGVASESDVGAKILKNLDIGAAELTGYLRENMSKSEKTYEEGSAPDLSPRAKQALQLAWHAARNLEHDYVGSEHVLLGLLEENDGLAAQTLKKYGISSTKLRQAVLSAVGEKGKKVGQAKEKSNTPTLDEYSRDLTALAEDGKLDPVIGRADEVQRVVQILSRRTKNNPVLIGEPGIGKTAIAEGLATRIINGEVPDTLKGKRVLSLDLPGMVAGTKYRGEFEDRIKKVIEEVEAASRTVILFIDELHTVVGAGAGGESGGMDAANILKPALARGELQVIGATTLNEYKKYIEKDGALERRFQPVLVEEPAVADAVEILRGIKDKYEAHHKISISDAAIVAAVTLSDKYIRDRFLPDKAIDLMDEASAKVRLGAITAPPELAEAKEALKGASRELSAAKRAKKKTDITKHDKKVKGLEKKIAKLEEAWKKKSGTSQLEVTPEDIAAIVSSWTGIPVQQLTQSERQRLLSLEAELHQRVIAQDEAVSAVSEAIRRNRAGLKDPARPQGSFLFLGPTGVGKTELTRALAYTLFGSEDAMVRLDMSEYMEKHAVSRMIGSPPGYIGHEEGGQLTEAVRRRPYSVILLDEIEKAHPDVFNILLQVLEDGRLTDGRGRTVDFRNSLIIMTSNVGSTLIQEATRKGAFTSEKEKKDLHSLLQQKLKEVFRPEFLNRVDETIIFHALEKVHVQQVADIMLDEVRRLVAAQGVTLEIDEKVRNRLAQDGFDPEFGARPLRREIQRRLENPLATQLLSGSFPKGSIITATLKGDSVVFSSVDPEVETRLSRRKAGHTTA